MEEEEEEEGELNSDDNKILLEKPVFVNAKYR